ncbi:hypothetical protein AAFF_G00304620 [Aldrovandia affinis]|uniref:Uncharacterized protein n=1 Tax=Aldrovandia affinis TaxID=143900 RepID=A0AAD7SPC4_9TELE|nr:hypothetical protein AAFF_G00304620 [Aldrovandia affinis]
MAECVPQAPDSTTHGQQADSPSLDWMLLAAARGYGSAQESSACDLLPAPPSQRRSPLLQPCPAAASGHSTWLRRDSWELVPETPSAPLSRGTEGLFVPARFPSDSPSSYLGFPRRQVFPRRAGAPGAKVTSPPLPFGTGLPPQLRVDLFAEHPSDGLGIP